DLWETIAAGKTWSGRMVNRRPDGTLYTVETGITPVRDPEGEIVNYAAALRDITGELKLEEQYRQAHKMEAVGQLAGGVAHDFNNILQAILGYADLLRADFPGTEQQLEYLSEIRNGGERAATLVRQLLAFSRRQVISLEPLDLNRVVEELLKMLRRVIGEDIRLEYFPGTHLGAVRGDVNMIAQVLLNLAVNARDAMPAGGKLTIETQNVLIDAEYCSEHAETVPGRYVLLSVTDTGSGMDEETRKRVFEPFFTTKEEGKGTGLGLAMVYGIVAQHEGAIRVYSEPGKGTAFKIYLPICERKAETVGDLVEGPVTGGGGDDPAGRGQPDGPEPGRPGPRGGGLHRPGRRRRGGGGPALQAGGRGSRPADPRRGDAPEGRLPGLAGDPEDPARGPGPLHQWLQRERDPHRLHPQGGAAAAPETLPPRRPPPGRPGDPRLRI
ncbi:MAG: ATP-binding protein, partial [Candidatus Erginobacter occultus]|nr:ATP-binding protein [Candidatus Erginobacter occultus]